MKSRTQAIKRATELAKLHSEPFVVQDLSGEQPHRPFVWDLLRNVDPNHPSIIYRTDSELRGEPNQ